MIGVQELNMKIKVFSDFWAWPELNQPIIIWHINVDFNMRLTTTKTHIKLLKINIPHQKT